MTSSISSLQYDYYSNPTAVPMRFGYVRIPNLYGVGAVSSIALGYSYYYRVIEGGTISAIRIYIGAPSGNICMAVYDTKGSGLNALPGNQVLTTGSIPCPGPGMVDVPLGRTISVTVDNWLSLSVDNTAATITGRGGLGSDPAVAGFFAAQNAYPAPAVAGAVASNSRMFSMVGVP